MDDVRFDAWMRSLEERHLADLTFPQASSALRALSAAYVERRAKLGEGTALNSAGKRAVFALFYGPLHYLLVQRIVQTLPGATAPIPSLVDLGSGSGASGAAWAASLARPPRVVAIDRHPWAVQETARSYREFGLACRALRGDIVSAPLGRGPTAILAAYSLNELPDAGREALMARLLDRAARGDRLLIVEPMAGFVARWWDRWRVRVEAAGGRADQWRFPIELPPIVAKLDRAAGLDHRELTGRSLYMGANRTSA